MRFPLICLVAVSVSLPMAWISLGKVLLFVSCLVYLLAKLGDQNRVEVFPQLWSARTILMTMLFFALSLTWSSAATDIALQALVKHSKVIEIVMLILLIRTEREARTAMAIFLIGQAFFLFSSWLMVAGVPVPWATSKWASLPQLKYVVYSTYLDQSIIFATVAAVFWHLRSIWPKSQIPAVVLAALALLNTLMLLDGRTGYVVALTMLTLAIMWAMPRRVRLVTVLIAPAIILAGAYIGSAKVSKRLSEMVSESQSYASQSVSESSSGFRLNAWRRSLQAMGEAPLLGHGVGSWTMTVKRLEGSTARAVFGDGPTSNPHQEYLLWGVELGIGGILLLLLFFASVLRDSFDFAPPIQRATLSVLAAAAVACLFNSSLYDALVGDFFCITLGLLMALGVQTHYADALKAKRNQPEMTV